MIINSNPHRVPVDSSRFIDKTCSSIAHLPASSEVDKTSWEKASVCLYATFMEHPGTINRDAYHGLTSRLIQNLSSPNVLGNHPHLKTILGTVIPISERVLRDLEEAADAPPPIEENRKIIERVSEMFEQVQPNAVYTPEIIEAASDCLYEAFLNVQGTDISFEDFKLIICAEFNTHPKLKKHPEMDTIKKLALKFCNDAYEELHPESICERIVNGETNIRIEGTLQFRTEILQYFAKLSETEKGRELLQRVRAKGEIVIREGAQTRCIHEEYAIEFNPQEICVSTIRDDKGELDWYTFPKFTMLAHELIHFVHYEKEPICYGDYPATIKGFPDLEEQYTVTGNRGDGYIHPLSENAICEAYGIPQRATYDASDYPVLIPGDLNLDNEEERITEAAKYGILANLRLLIEEHEVDVESVVDHGKTPLNLAAENGHFDAVAYLVSQGASVNTQSDDGNTPLHWAAYNRDLPLFLFLILNQASLNIVNDAGYTPIQLLEYYKENGTFPPCNCDECQVQNQPLPLPRAPLERASSLTASAAAMQPLPKPKLTRSTSSTI